VAPSVAPTPTPLPSPHPSPPALPYPPPAPPYPPPALLADCAAVFLPGDPPRRGRIAFWHPDGEPPTAGDHPLEELAVVLPGADGRVRPRTVPALVLSVADALPLLTRIRAARREGAPAFWGAAALQALQLAARGRLLPGLSPLDHDAWRLGPLDPADLGRLRDLAAAMPPHAHAVPLPRESSAGPGEPRLPEPERLLRAFLDAVADTLPRTPAAELAAGGPAFATDAPQHLPEQRAWAADVAAGHDAGVRLSLRVEVSGLTGTGSAQGAGGTGSAPRFRAVLQVHDPADPALVADAAELWSGASPAAADLGPRARADALLTLRRAAAAWEPLTPLLSATVPEAVDLTDEEVAELLGAPVTRALRAAGLTVHWPRELATTLTTRAVVGPEDTGTGGDPGDAPTAASRASSPLSADALLSFSWRFAIGDQELSREELDRIAEAGRPLVRLRDRWVLLDPEAVRRARSRRDRKVTPLDALGAGAALTGTVPADAADGHGDGNGNGDGPAVEVRATGWLEALRDRLADPERPDPDSAPQPPGLAATLRDYQLRGLNWLHRMTSLGLGCCLADDMGLGKTVTLIALHLHRQRDPGSAGPTLVVCPASLLGNWQREIERFAPGTPVRRHHGAGRDLSDPPGDGFVLTTYGTMRLDADDLAAVDWGLVVADEAQHVKNPFSSTARRLRAIPARARVALTGTPVENNLSELWAILDWTTPGLLGRLGTFRRLHADAVERGAGADGDPAAAQRLTRLVRPFLLRRRKSDPGIAPELPPKTETDRAVALTAEQAGLYEAVVREGLADISGTEGLARRGRVVGLLTALKQICNHPAQYLKEENPRLAGRSGKLELLDELLDTILSEGASVLVFTQYVRMARLLERHLADRGVRTQCLHGGTPVRRREEMVARFQSGEVPVLLLSLKAAGTGLNLTRAEHVVHFDRWWNPAVEAQATDRAYRIGQDRPVQVHRLVTEGTIEDRIAGMLARKQALADAVLGSGEAALTELTDAELADLVALRGGER